MEKKDLAEWTKHYFKNKDILTKQIINIKEGKDFDLVIEKKDKKQFIDIFISLEDISLFLNKVKDSSDQFTLVLLNTKPNLEQVKKSWASLSKHRNLTIIFSNPNSTTETRWIINPYIHSRITEKSALSKGLDALFESVEPA